MRYLARAVLGLSSALAAAIALIPPLIFGLLLLFDQVGRAVFGASNAMLAVPGQVFPLVGRGDLLPWTGVAMTPAEAALLSTLKGVPALIMLLVALRPSLIRGLARKLLFDLIVVAGLVCLGLPAAVLLLPAALAAVAIQLLDGR